MSEKTESDHGDIEHEFNGKTYRGSYNVTSGWVKLSTGFGEKSAVLGAFSPPVLARILFVELLREEDLKGRLDK
jgi:hypothetical protein